jgi:ATP-binding cassette, subfamily C, bacteriocin exporter
MDLAIEPDRGCIGFEPGLAGDIRFDGVDFQHAGRVATLRGISLTLPAGRISALVGASGCGKSTLLALIQRLYPVPAGRIFIGEHDIQYYRLESLRRHLAVVPQQTRMLTGTVLENLAPGDYQPDMRRLLRICREVGILDFIEKLPQGFFTHLSENGATLSGGQRQRLALVRALYSDAPILLLDEPSSALDAEAELVLMKILQRLRQEGRTIVLAAHSNRLLEVADQIVILSEGCVTSIRHASNCPDRINGDTSLVGAA